VKVEHPSVVRRVADEQHETIELRVSELEGRPPFQGLHIAETSLRFDGHRSRIQPQHDIPRTTVSRQRYRDLGGHPDCGWEDGSKSPDERELTSVERRAGTGNGSDQKIKTDGSTRATQLLDRQPVDFTTLDSSEVCV
jgi:hypothetical protein